MNILKVLGALIICGMIGAVAVTIILKVVIYGIYVAVGAFVACAAFMAWAMLRLFKRT